jgi:hypothetical protein
MSPRCKEYKRNASISVTKDNEIVGKVDAVICEFAGNCKFKSEYSEYNKYLNKLAGVE